MRISTLRSQLSWLIGLCLIIALSFYSSPSWAVSAIYSKKVERDLDNLINSLGINLNIGVKVQDLKDNRVIYHRNADRTFIPASNLKLFTALAGLALLGPDYHYTTQVLTDNDEINNGELNGNLYFQFSGDPQLRLSDLETIVKALQKQGIERINGNVYIDDTAFGDITMGPGWMWDDAKHCFSAPVSASILNQNCINVQVKPGQYAGYPLQVKFNRYNQYISLVNETTTRAAGKKGCNLSLSADLHNRYVLEGCLPQDGKRLTLSVALQDPESFSQTALAGLLTHHGIWVNGEVLVGSTGNHKVVLAKHDSKPLGSLVNIMLKESDNLISDSLFKKIGEVYFKAPGTWKSGSKAIKKVLEGRLKVNLNNAVLVDGSGLSRYNLVTPNQIVSLLRSGYSSSQLQTPYLASLPVSGIDGTLKYRMKADGIRGRVLAKTGTMANVTSLSGYVKTASNRTLAFSIMINGISGSLGRYLALEDRICQYLVNL